MKCISLYFYIKTVDHKLLMGKTVVFAFIFFLINGIKFIQRPRVNLFLFLPSVLTFKSENFFCCMPLKITRSSFNSMHTLKKFKEAIWKTSSYHKECKMLHWHNIQTMLDLRSLSPPDISIYAPQQMDCPFLKLPRWLPIFQHPIQDKEHSRHSKC